MSTENNIEIEKNNALILMQSILKELNTHFTWKAVEIAISFNDRLGKDNPLAVHCFEGILSKELQEKLDEYLPECTENTMEVSDIISQMFGSTISPDYAKINASLANTPFPFNREIAEECQAWDKNDNSSSRELQDDKEKSIMLIKMKLRELTMLKTMMSNNYECYGDECIAIDTIIEILDYSIV